MGPKERNINETIFCELHYNINDYGRERKLMLEFREIRPKISKNMPEERRRHWHSLGISVAAHVVFLSFIFLVIAPVRVYVPARNVRRVFIAPAQKLFFPEGYAGEQEPATAIVPESELLSSPPASGQAPAGSRAAGAEGGIAPGGRISSPSGGSLETEPGLSTSGWSSRFQLSLPALAEKRPVGDRELNLELNLIPRDSQMDRLLQQAEKYREQKRVDLSQYRPSNYMPGISGIGSRNRPGGSRTANTAPRITLQEVNYDLAPWADKVLAKIQKTWLVSSDQLSQAIGKVEILVIVNKSGAIESVKIVQPSHTAFLDETVLKALELSAPFPNLPYTFPEERLEVRMKFLTR